MVEEGIKRGKEAKRMKEREKRGRGEGRVHCRQETKFPREITVEQARFFTTILLN